MSAQISSIFIDEDTKLLIYDGPKLSYILTLGEAISYEDIINIFPLSNKNIVIVFRINKRITLYYLNLEFFNAKIVETNYINIKNFIYPNIAVAYNNSMKTIIDLSNNKSIISIHHDDYVLPISLSGKYVNNRKYLAFDIDFNPYSTIIAEIELHNDKNSVWWESDIIMDKEPIFANPYGWIVDENINIVICNSINGILIIDRINNTTTKWTYDELFNIKIDENENKIFENIYTGINSVYIGLNTIVNDIVYIIITLK